MEYSLFYFHEKEEEGIKKRSKRISSTVVVEGYLANEQGGASHCCDKHCCDDGWF